MSLRPLLRLGLYLAVLTGAATMFVGSMEFSFKQTVRQVAERPAAHKPARLRPSYLAPTPTLTSRAFDAARPAVAATGEAAKAQMGIEAVDPMTTGSVPNPAGEPKPDLFRTDANGLNVRLGPSNGGAKVLVLNIGEEVEVAVQERNWVRVIRSDGKGGRVYSTYLVPVE
jgi:uncharacterized protein YgiM (DUF1202 family)